ncbi:MAG: adenosine deaminase [Lachnospiraceae bacterium]|nr:adenosine deaminase [Lachnospiraceae bacterium]
MKERESYIDLHLHLDGAITPQIARKLAKLQGIPLFDDEEKLKEQLSVPADCNNLNDFLKCFELPLSLLQTEAGVEEAIYLVQEAVKADGVIYGEIRFAPQLHCRQGLSQEQVVIAALKGLKRSSLACNLILCCMRGENLEKANLETVYLAKKYLVVDGGITAIDLAGAEGLYPTKDYESIFKIAVEERIPFTIHAGEAAGADSIWQAIKFGASRIGHGIRAQEDNNLMKELADKNICLELCPTSNRQTKAVLDMNQYPLGQFLEQGLCVTINTDDMAISRTNIQKEFAYIKSAFGISKEQEDNIKENAIESAFTSSERKKQLKEFMGL